jgi:hypothetical protein
MSLNKTKLCYFYAISKYIHIIHRNTQTQYKQTGSCTQMFALCGNRTRDILSTRRVFPPLRHMGRQIAVNCLAINSKLVSLFRISVQECIKKIHYRSYL